MLRWLGNKKASPEPLHRQTNHNMLVEPKKQQQQQQHEEITDDPLATFETNHHGPKPIYSVSRSVLLLPRVTLKTTDRGVNPLFRETEDEHRSSSTTTPTKPHVQSGGKSTSSGYGGSNGGCSTTSLPDPIYIEQTKLRDDLIMLLEQNPNVVKSIQLASKFGRNNTNTNPNNNSNNNNNNKSVTSGSSTTGGTLTTIPEGRVDLPIPKPIWPQQSIDKNPSNYDSIVDDALLFYTSLNNNNNNVPNLFDNRLELSVREILVELLNNINATMAGNTGLTSEEMLKIVNDKIAASLESLKISTEEEMRKLCVNLSNCNKINSVLRALNNSPSTTKSTSSGDSSQNSPEWNRNNNNNNNNNNNRVRTISSETDDIYQIPSGSSSSGFSDYALKDTQQLPIFHHEDIGSVTNGVRNAMIYGTLYRHKSGVYNNLDRKTATNLIKKNCLITVHDDKPSVWEQYYGVRAVVSDGDVKYTTRPTDVPVYPGGRPEADFTLDLPRSEMLSKRMKQDKKWRCRCRLLTSFLGLVFFLLSVMAVSLMLTRGKRMFGSMM